MSGDKDEALAYLVALNREVRKWRWRRWKNPPRVLLWAIRSRFPSKQDTVDLWGMPYSRNEDVGFYADRRDFKDALADRSVRQLWLVTVCWLRGHNMPIQVCVRCKAFIP